MFKLLHLSFYLICPPHCGCSHFRLVTQLADLWVTSSVNAVWCGSKPVSTVSLGHAQEGRFVDDVVVHRSMPVLLLPGFAAWI